MTQKDMKHIKQQVQHDVQLLRNRVRMLQQEHDRAQKKIEEAAQKADHLERLKADNERKYLLSVIEEEKRHEEVNGA